MLLCGWSPPAGAMVVSASCVRGDGGAYIPMPIPLANNSLFAFVSIASLFDALCVCVCEGISDSSSVTVSLPPVSPRSCSESPGPCPGCIGALPCMLGRAKFDLPSPPYTVPRSENKAVFCERGKICPSQKAQPLGAKLNGKMRISARKGSIVILLLSLRRENPEERNDEINAQVGLKITMRLTASGRTYHLRSHLV